VVLLLEASRRKLLTDASRRLHVDSGKVSGQTPLYIAAKNGHVACVELLLTEGANTDLFRTYDRMTPLIIAAHGGHTDVVRALLDASADTEVATTHSVRSETGMTKAGLGALDAAMTGGHVACARLIASRSPWPTTPEGTLDTTDLAAALDVVASARAGGKY
jgi:ankyrin repeat protein